MLKVGFIGLGNVGGKLAGSLLRNGVKLTVRDLDIDALGHFTRTIRPFGAAIEKRLRNVGIQDPDRQLDTIS